MGPAENASSNQALEEPVPEAEMPQLSTNPVTRMVLQIAGVLSLILGLIGIIVPLLPTTPLLLLSAACFARSSPKFYHWLLSHPYMGQYIRNYQEGRGIPARDKFMAILVMWATILTSAYLFMPYLWARIPLVVIAILVSIYLLRLPTLVREDSSPGPVES